MLEYYGTQFATVEINSTFYRMPAEKTLERWRSQVPGGFVFVLKASRRITHQRRLKDTEDTVEYLLNITTALGDKLGPFLFQLPPNFQKDLPRLQTFLALIPGERRAVFEFRHPSWYAADVFDALREHDTALCIVDAGKEGDAPFVSTATWGYLRLRQDEYSDEELDDWAGKVRGAAWSDTFAFFKHEDAGIGPKLAARFGGLFENSGS